MRNMAVYKDPLILDEVGRCLSNKGFDTLIDAQKALGLGADGVLGPKTYAALCDLTEQEVLGQELTKYFEEALSPNQRAQRRLQVTLIVMHWTAGGDFQGVINWFLDPKAQVSAHYLIGVDGDVCRQVREEHVGWHAGPASLGNYGQQINDCSIGIEMCGPPSMVGKKEWTTRLLQSAIILCRDIQSRFPDIHITDHSTILPAQKVDVKKGVGIDVFPWDWFVEQTGIPEAHPTDIVPSYPG